MLANIRRWFASLFSIKYGALALLVLQNTFLVVLMGYSRTRQTDKLYSSSTAVAVMEVVKFACCLLVIAYDKGSLRALWKVLQEELFSQRTELLKLAVPSVLYSIQNNLLYYALSHLDAATFQVGYQVKILTTAVFSVLMLGKSLSSQQWVALVILTVGVSLTQLSASQRSSTSANSTLGFVAVLAAACTSGFGGVYFEKLLKNSGTSVWMRNLQMGVFSILSGFLGIYMSGELPTVRARGFFFGYNSLVVSVILLQAVGGLIVAVVVKYADNILKGFAASFSIITSCVLSIFFFNFRPNAEFLAGAMLVNVSMYLYSQMPTHADKEIVGGVGSTDNRATAVSGVVSATVTVHSDSNIRV
jgi:solute carrier family 35 (UDP-sugar transporter), member A1/2/3